jgi:hypothetical protein
MTHDRWLTYQDLAEYCMALRHGGSRTLEQTDLKAAIAGAYADVHQAHNWHYYDTEHRIFVQPNYSTGTVAYDHAGHAQGDRALTITGGAWPAWIVGARLRLNDIVCRVERLSGDADTVLLDAVLNPGEDVASQTFVAYQAMYLLPEDLALIEDVLIEEGVWTPYYMEPSEWLQSERYSQSVGRPWGWTIMKDPSTLGRWGLFVDPVPNRLEPLGFIYRRSPRPLRYVGVEATARVLASGTAGSTTLTTTVALPETMLGSVIRIGTTADYPTGLLGSQPYVEQHQIYDLSSTTVTLRTPLGANVASSTKCVVTDPIDMAETMQEALKARVEYRLLRMYGAGEDRTKNVGQGLALADRELRIALERESRIQIGRRASYLPFRQWMKRIPSTTAS